MRAFHHYVIADKHHKMLFFNKFGEICNSRVITSQLDAFMYDFDVGSL